MDCSCGNPLDSIYHVPRCNQLTSLSGSAQRVDDNTRSDSILAGKKLSLKSSLLLIFYFNLQSLTNLGPGYCCPHSNQLQDGWGVTVNSSVATWFFGNSTPLGGTGKIVKLDEAKVG